MGRSSSPRPDISLFDIFIGSGRTIRRPSGPPGTHHPKTQLVRVRPSRSASLRETNGSGSKPGSLKVSNGAGSKPGSAKAGSNKEHASSGSKPSSAKEGSKPNSKPSSAKAASNEKTTDEKKASEGPKTSDEKPKPNHQQPGDVVFTAEEDAKLLLMKSEGKNWPDIAAAIGKTKKQTTKRFGEIKPADWKPQRGGKHGIDKEGVIDEKNDKPTKEKSDRPAKAQPEEAHKSEHKNEHKPEDRKSKTSKSIERTVPEPTADKHRHHHHKSHTHHEHHKTHPHTHDIHLKIHHAHHPKHHHHVPTPSVASSSRTAYTIKTMPSLSEDDLFSFGELQAVSELIGKDMEGMWHRVSAAFFGMTGRRIAAGDIKEKFAGLEVEDE